MDQITMIDALILVEKARAKAYRQYSLNNTLQQQANICDEVVRLLEIDKAKLKK